MSSPKRTSSRMSNRTSTPLPAEPKVPNIPTNPITKLDRVLDKLTLILSTPAGTDSLLRTITYTLQFLVCGIQEIFTNHLDKIMNLVVAVNRLMPKSKPKTIGGPPKAKTKSLMSYIPTPALMPLMMKGIPRAKKLSALISDFRSFTRLWGLLGMYAWAKSLYVTPPTDTILKLVAWGQCIAYTAYQGYENRAYLAGKGIWSKRDGKDIMSDWLWSSRMWMVGVGLEFVRLIRVRQLWKSKNLTIEQQRKEKAAWRRELIANVANAPLTVHWSVDGGTLGDTTVGLLGMIGGAAGLNERWRAAGEALGD